MNQYISDWSGAMGDTFAPLGGGDDDGLIELLWCNGHVVMQSQAPAPRKPPRPDKAAAAAAAVQQDDVAAAAQAWFAQYPVEEDSLERDDLFSELFGEAQAAVDGAARAGACCKAEEAEDEERGDDDEAARHSSGIMPPPPPPPLPRPTHAPREEKACPGDGAVARTSGCCEATAPTTTEGGESSMLTIGSSFCGSNHVQTPPPRARDRGAVTPPVTSSATRSRSCTNKSEHHPGPGAAAAANAHRSGKRKQSDATDAEDVEFESADVTCEPAAQKTTTAKRRRAAEVHNLSERRRRDRINEKMKALQDLIPHCNKTDKASMLDEAIEYLKSLQLQLQMMWMGGGMAAAAAPVVFPAGVHQYMQRMVPPHHVASMPPGMPFMAAPPAVQGPPLPDLYARYLAVDHHHLPPPPMVPASPNTVQQHCLQGTTMGFYQRQNPAPPPPPAAVPAAPPPSDGILHKRYESCGKPEIQGMTG